MEAGEEAGVPLLKVEEVPAVVEGEEDHPCSLEEVLLGGPRREQQGVLGKENLEGECDVKMQTTLSQCAVYLSAICTI